MLRKFNRVTVIVVVLSIFLLSSLYLRDSSRWNNLRVHFGGKGDAPLQKTERDVLKSLSLEEKQCQAAFPGLTQEIENAVSQGPFELKRLGDDTPGLVQGRIKNGKLYIISAVQDNALHRVPAILHSLHRAIITSPTRLPDTIFALTINDNPRSNTWSFAHSADEYTPDTPWLMPHYSSWSWPLESLGPMDEALTRIERVEKETTWEQKISKAIWRGTAWFNPDWRAGLRPILVEVAKEKEWADVEVSGQGQNNILDVADFCKYKYVIYAEGKTYSGRLPFHQACASIILTPAPTFLLHTTHLLRPIFSSLLPLNSSSRSHPNFPTTPHADSYPLPATATTWPVSYPPDLANIVFVQPDWSDLEETIAYFENNPGIAKGIAGRQRALTVGGGYLSEAAEACYWRSLITAWSSMAKMSDESEWGEGMRFETYILLGKTTYE